MKRQERHLSLVLELQARSWQRAEDLAETFGVSTRTIYRDMQALEAAGVPVVAVPGKGYRLFEGYFLPPLMFTYDEAGMLLLGCDYVVRHFDEGYRTAAQAARRRIEAALPAPRQAQVEALRESIRLVPVNAFDNPREQDQLRLLRRALLNQNVIAFRYPARAGTNGSAMQHRVQPYGLVSHADGWRLVGHSLTQGRVLTYQVERMDQIETRAETFERPAGYRLQRPTAPPGVVVRVLFAESVARWVEASPSAFVEETEPHGDGLLVTFRVERETELMPWLLSWGAYVRVLEPLSLRRRLAREAEQVLAQHQTDPVLLP